VTSVSGSYIKNVLQHQRCAPRTEKQTLALVFTCKQFEKDRYFLRVNLGETQSVLEAVTANQLREIEEFVDMPISVDEPSSIVVPLARGSSSNTHFRLSEAMGTKRHISRLSWLLCLFLSAKDIEAFLGDLGENHALIANRSTIEADRWLRREILRSIPPLVWAQFKRSFGVDKFMAWYRR
jgi:hypothetical protein